MRLIAFFTLMLFAALPAMADEYVHAPEGCGFQITFPGEPHTTRRCHDRMTDKCQLMTGYTEVFEMSATMNFYVSCQPSTPALRKDFTPDLIRTSLLARPYVDTLEVYDITYDDSPEAMKGALFGAGKSANGQDLMVYVAQLWVGDTSVFSIEAEMIGDQIPEADKKFGAVLASLKAKPSATAGEQASPADSKDTPKSEDKPAPATEDKPDNAAEVTDKPAAAE